MAYVVVAPLVQLKIRDAAGALVYRQFLAGAVLDTDEIRVEEDNLQSHLDSGQVVDENDPVVDVFAVPAGTPLPGQPPNTEVTESSSTAQPQPPFSDEQLKAAGIKQDSDSDGDARSGRPRVTDDKATWLDYRVNERVAQRSDDVSEEDARAQARAELEGKSKADLVAGR